MRGPARRAKLTLERARARWGAVDAGVRVLRRYSEDDGGFHAASLTYYMFFSIFPLTLFAASALGYVTFLSETMRERILDAGLDALPLLDAVTSPEAIATLQQRRGTLVFAGLALVLYAGSGGVVALGHALDRIHRVESQRRFLASRAASLKWIAVIGLAAITSMAFGAAANYAGAFFPGRASRAAAVVLGYAGGFLVGVFLFATAFRFLPSKARSWSEVLPGALVAAVGFEVLKVAGAWYLARGAAIREQTFGAFAGAAGLLVASYLLAQVTLVAAEYNAVLAERRAIRKRAEPG